MIGIPHLGEELAYLDELLERTIEHGASAADVAPREVRREGHAHLGRCELADEIARPVL